MMDKKRILVADDNRHMTETLVDILTYLEYEVVQVANGADAIRETQQRSFDLVLLDVQMPQVNGIAAFYAIQKIRPQIPILLMTGWVQNRELEQVRQTGAARVFTKPFDPEQLIKEIRQLVQAGSQPTTILIVDDDPLVCNALKRQLIKHEYVVDMVLRGRDAIEIMHRRQYDIVFLDICLPDINGLEVYARIKKQHPQTIGIMMTGFGNEPQVKQLIREAREEGHVCLEKPFPVEDVLSLIDQICRD